MKEHGVPNSKLTVLRRAENKGHHIMWECVCECGNDIVADGYNIKHNKLSCGCDNPYSFIDMTGWVMKEHGVPESKLTVIRLHEKGNYKPTTWECLCECGNICIKPGNRIRFGNAISCGCISAGNKKRKHKTGIVGEDYKKFLTRHLRIVWYGMKQRCYDKEHGSYKNYGGRGISVCKNWLNDSQSFIDWAFNTGYAPGLTLDRIDCNGNYDPDNCRWATAKEQGNNRRTNYCIEIDGVIHTLQEWSDISGVNRSTIKTRMGQGMSAKDAIFNPINNGGIS